MKNTKFYNTAQAKRAADYSTVELLEIKKAEIDKEKRQNRNCFIIGIVGFLLFTIVFFSSNW